MWVLVQVSFTSLQQRLQEVLQAVREAAHHVAGVAVLRKEEGQLQVWILLQLDLSAITPRQLICCVLCHCHHVVYQLLHTNTHSTRQTKLTVSQAMIEMKLRMLKILDFVHLSYRRDVRLVRSTMVVGHECVELQGVELKAGVVDVLHILHGVFVHGQQGGGLEETHRKCVNEHHILHSS